MFYSKTKPILSRTSQFFLIYNFYFLWRTMAKQGHYETNLCRDAKIISSTVLFYPKIARGREFILTFFAKFQKDSNYQHHILRFLTPTLIWEDFFYRSCKASRGRDTSVRELDSVGHITQGTVSSRGWFTKEASSKGHIIQRAQDPREDFRGHFGKDTLSFIILLFFPFCC